ncbi:MAG: ABC transporter ATP-binding protein [Acidobacteria bacterium]|nr:ABC transporter ATP-binding protein [Acidobacteriota bacterium]MBV9478463.1 ABC transporter ATP-binding protein [Acidobacteriota bacterium]
MLELRDVAYAYAGAPALRDVTLRVGQRELVALAGPNGSGKSTLLKLIARVFAPQRGTIAFEGTPLAQWLGKDYAKRVGYLPQDPDPAFPMRALDVVVTGRAPYLGRFAWESARDWDEARAALALCDAEHLAERYLDEMSGGERKRVFLARVLAGQPRLILLDEPLAALDLAHVQQFAALLRDVVDRTGATVLFAAHDLNWAAAHSDRMLVMQQGALALDAAPSEVMRAEVVRALFGLEVETVARDGRTWIVPRVT